MIFLSIGSNLSSVFGNRFDNIKKSIDLLKREQIEVLKISNFFETPSYPNKKFPKFINVVAKVKFNLTPEILIKKIFEIEKKMGRIKTIKNNPRTCDIDIIDFKSIVHNSKKVILPHPHAHRRNFVLYPLKEVCKNWTHPINKQKVDFLINNLSLISRNEITRMKEHVILAK